MHIRNVEKNRSALNIFEYKYVQIFSSGRLRFFFIAESLIVASSFGKSAAKNSQCLFLEQIFARQMRLFVNSFWILNYYNCILTR